MTTITCRRRHKRNVRDASPNKTRINKIRVSINVTQDVSDNDTQSERLWLFLDILEPQTEPQTTLECQ